MKIPFHPLTDKKFRLKENEEVNGQLKVVETDHVDFSDTNRCQIRLSMR